MAIIKPDLSQQWASDGDKIAPSGAKIQAGWGPEIPPYQWENFIQNRQDEMLAYLNERGLPEWDIRTNYVGGGKSYVQGSDGVVYKSVATSGPDTSVQNPTADPTGIYWEEAFASTDDSRITGAAQKADNLSDLTSVSAARQNLGLGTAATANLTTSNTDGTAGRVLKVGDGGWMGQGEISGTAYGYPTSINDVTNQTKVIRAEAIDNGVQISSAGIHFAADATWGRLRVAHSEISAWIQGGISSSGAGWTSQMVLSDNLQQETGNSTEFPMSQAAVTDAINNNNSIGIGQTWQDVTGSREVGVTYTNTTGRPIQIFVTFDPTGVGPHFEVDGVDILPVSDTTLYQVSCVIPAGSTYRMITQGGISQTKWVELR